MQDSAISIRGLGKRYRLGQGPSVFTLRDTLSRMFAKRAGRPTPGGPKELWAVKDVDLEIAQGEVVGVIGRNGAGKSTLLKMLAKITEPSKGYADISGRVGSLLEVGTGFHGDLTGRENIYLNGAILGMGRQEIRSKFDQIVAFSEVGAFLDTPVKRYSSGMAVRLAFSVAAHLEPEILLVDEVLAVGDVGFQKKCLGKMNDVAREGRTVLFVSHNMGTIADLCSRCVLMDQGQVAADGPAEQVIGAYLSTGVGDGEVTLDQWRGARRGEGPMRVRAVATMDADGQCQGQFAYGQRIRFRIEVEGATSIGCIIGVNIHDATGRLAMHLNNVDDATRVVLPDERSVVHVDLDENILNDGVYHLTIWLGDEMNVLHDEVSHCLSFEVVSVNQGSIRCRANVRTRAAWQTLALGA